MALFGHAREREIAGDPELARRTISEGKRILSQQSRETDAEGKSKGGKRDRRSELQFSWIKYRHVTMEEMRPILLRQGESEATVNEVASLLQATNLVHVVVANIHDENFVVTTYFANPQHMSDLTDLIRSVLIDFLDSDDPTVISDAMGDPIFLGALRADFESGDRQDSRLWKTPSKLKSPLNVLQHCCENNYAACVEMLLANHALQTAEEPWQTLAEPNLWTDDWRNTAFHSAAYCGSAESLEHLAAFAHLHRVDVASLLDKDGKTALEVAEKKGNFRCYDILAPLFGVPRRGGSIGDTERLDRRATILVDYGAEGSAGGADADADVEGYGLAVGAADLLAKVDLKTQRLTAELSALDGERVVVVPSGRLLVRVMTGGGLLWDVYQPPQKLSRRLRRLASSGDAQVYARLVPRLRCHVPEEGTAADVLVALRGLLDEMPPETAPRQFRLIDYRIRQAGDDDSELFREVFELLRTCTALNLYKCLCDPPTLLHICQAARTVLETGSPSWTQLYIFPSCVNASEERPDGFCAELPRLVAALRASSVLHISRFGCKACGIPVGPLPPAARPWADVLATCLDVNRFVSHIKKWRELGADARGDRGDGVPALFLHGVLRIWRHQLNHARLCDPGVLSVEGALDPGVETYVTEWLKNVSWAFSGAGAGGSLEGCRARLGLEPEELGEVLEHLDFAVWALLRMHRLLPYAPRAAAEHLPPGVFERLGRARAYWRKKAWNYPWLGGLPVDSAARVLPK